MKFVRWLVGLYRILVGRLSTSQLIPTLVVRHFIILRNPNTLHKSSMNIGRLLVEKTKDSLTSSKDPSTKGIWLIPLEHPPKFSKKKALTLRRKNRKIQKPIGKRAIKDPLRIMPIEFPVSLSDEEEDPIKDFPQEERKENVPPIETNKLWNMDEDDVDSWPQEFGDTILDPLMDIALDLWQNKKDLTSAMMKICNKLMDVKVAQNIKVHLSACFLAARKNMYSRAIIAMYHPFAVWNLVITACKMIEAPSEIPLEQRIDEELRSNQELTTMWTNRQVSDLILIVCFVNEN